MMISGSSSVEPFMAVCSEPVRAVFSLAALPNWVSSILMPFSAPMPLLNSLTTSSKAA